MNAVFAGSVGLSLALVWIGCDSCFRAFGHFGICVRMFAEHRERRFLLRFFAFLLVFPLVTRVLTQDSQTFTVRSQRCPVQYRAVNCGDRLPRIFAIIVISEIVSRKKNHGLTVRIRAVATVMWSVPIPAPLASHYNVTSFRKNVAA